MILNDNLRTLEGEVAGPPDTPYEGSAAMLVSAADGREQDTPSRRSLRCAPCGLHGGVSCVDVLVCGVVCCFWLTTMGV